MRFYVYALCDPETEAPFYIGKGQGGRAYQHVPQALKGRKSNAAKTARILEIVNAGKEVLVKILERFEDEATALVREAQLIGKTPNLTNIVLCSDPSSRTPKQDILSPAVTREIAKFRKWLAMVDTWEGVTFPGMYNGNVHAENFVWWIRRYLDDLEAKREEARSGIRKPSPTESVRSWLTGPVSGPFAYQTSFLP